MGLSAVILGLIRPEDACSAYLSCSPCLLRGPVKLVESCLDFLLFLGPSD